MTSFEAPYLPRALEPILKKSAREFPVVVLTGPRQAGKTTLLRHLFGESHRYISLEPPDIRAIAVSDPRGFLEAHPPPVILDEVQYAPALLPYIKEHVDADRRRRGQYLLTGSHNLLLGQGVTETLAGRAGILRLLPLSRREVFGNPKRPFPWEVKNPSADTKPAAGSLWEDFLRGGYPELAAEPERDANRWHASFVQTYLERDVRSLRQVGDLTQFQNFLRALAARSAQLLSLTDLSRDLGVAVNTVKAWLSVLEATYQVIVLRPYFANVGKRLVKSPKVYFADTGTLCYLTGLKSVEHAAAGPMGGAIFETAVLGEIVRTLVSRGVEPRVYFWRTATGAEVDFVVDTGEGLVPIEAKLSSTPRTEMASGISAFRACLGKKVVPGYVVHLGALRLPLGSDAAAFPFLAL